MRKLLGLGTAVAVVFAMAGTADARPLNWEGTFSARIAALPELDVTGGGVATVNGSSGPIPAHLDTIRVAASRGNVTGTDTNIITDPEAAGNGIAAIILNLEPGTGTLGPISGAVSSTVPALTQRILPIGGVAKLCLLSTVCTDFLPLLLTQPTTNGARFSVNTATPNQLTPGGGGKRLAIPGTGTKGLGIGGLVTVGGDSAIRISLEAAPWTIKTATAIDQTDDNTGSAAFHNVTRMGFAHAPSSGTTSTAQPSGVLQIVTPNQVRTNLTLGSNVKVAAVAELLIHFIPEPGLLLLLGSGVVGLALLGRNRMRR
jgi:hypothetical protein